MPLAARPDEKVELLNLILRNAKRRKTCLKFLTDRISGDIIRYIIFIKKENKIDNDCVNWLIWPFRFEFERRKTFVKINLDRMRFIEIRAYKIISPHEPKPIQVNSVDREF